MGCDITKTDDPGDATSPARRIRRLVQVHGPGAGRLVYLDPGETIEVRRASDPAVTIGLDDPRVSRPHARIAWSVEDRSFAVIDLDSKNGTWIDGRRQVRGLLSNGTVLRFGTCLFVVEEANLPAHVTLLSETTLLRGASLALHRIRGDIQLVAEENNHVLISGETGVGKELVAEEIHRRSKRAGPFVPVNCGAIALLESELFGHVKGAFTDAAADKTGLFVLANEGTIFLDEIGEMPLDHQVKLLRALSSGEVRPVGSTKTITHRARVISATNRDLREAVARSTFRADLYARLAGWQIDVPPLRERRADILPIAMSVLKDNDRFAELSAAAAEALLLYDWPFNVRELEWIVDVAALRAGRALIGLQHLPPELGGGAIAVDPPPPGDAPGKCPDRDSLVALLQSTNGNVSEAARALGVYVNQLRRWLARHDIHPDAFRPEPRVRPQQSKPGL